MKRVIKLAQQTPAQAGITYENDIANDTDNDTTNEKNKLNFMDVVGILNQLEELKNYNIAVYNEDGNLLLEVGESTYQVSGVISNHYPRRRLRKLEN